jgi:hypothetical protein
MVASEIPRGSPSGLIVKHVNFWFVFIVELPGEEEVIP